MKTDGDKKISPAFLPLLALSLAVLLWPVCRWTEEVFSPVLGRTLLVVLTVLGAATVVSYMLPVSKLRSVLHGIGEFFYPLFLTALPLLLATDVLYYFKVPVRPEKALTVLGAVFLPLAAAGLASGLGLRVKRYKAVLPGAEGMRIVLLSDLHLGYFTPASLSEKLTDAILKEKPDLVIVAGDFFDDRFDSLSEKRRERILAGFKRLSAAVPVYGCEGNHDLLCRDKRKDAFLKECGMTVLCDEALLCKGRRLVFRRDVRNAGRRPAEEVFPQDGIPTVAVDHSPFAYREAWDRGVSLVLSGHTHGGQTFPGTLLYKNRFMRGYGFHKEGDMQLIVTSGAGVYGCPVRLGAAREIVCIEINSQPR